MNVPQRVLRSLGLTFIRESQGIQEYRLNNGLKILLSENHVAPVVTIMQLFQVGSRNEAVGHTGATHLLEHMMFKGVKDGRTGEVYDFPTRFHPLGGIWNATTSYDRTNYFATVPAHCLEQCIATESDRMRNLLIKEEERASEMTVVRNELERGENEPTSVLRERLYAAAFREHPYHHPVIGWTSDIENTSVERLKAFYDVYYHPNNATLLLMGAFDSAQALTWVSKYYSGHPAAAHVIPDVHTVEPPQEGQKRFAVERVGGAPALIMGWHVPEATHADNYALAGMAAVLHGRRKSSRLYKALVGKGLASEAVVWHHELRDPGMFMVIAVPAEGVALQTVERAILAEIKALAHKPVSQAELNRSKISRRKATELAASDPMKLANMLGAAESVADWTFHTQYNDRLAQVTPQDISRVAGEYFRKSNRTVGYYIPKKPGKSQSVSAASTSQVKPPATIAEQTIRKTLPNGLTLCVLPKAGTGIVGIAGALNAGNCYAANGKVLVPGLVAHELKSGTTTGRSAVGISQALEEMGADVRFGTGLISMAFNCKVSTLDAEGMVKLIAEMLQHPAFPEKELATYKQAWLVHLRKQASDPDSVAGARLSTELYPPTSCFSETSISDLLTELQGITSADLQAFHKSVYTPQGMVLTIVGDVDVEQITNVVEAAFGNWQGAAPRKITEAAPVMPEQPRRVNIFIPDKRSATAVLGHPSTVERSASDYHAAHLGDAILGSGFTSRLMQKVRKEAGLTYGISSHLSDNMLPGGPFTIELSVHPQNVERALTLIASVVEELLKEGVTAHELSAEIGYSTGSFQVALRNPEALAHGITTYEFKGLGVAEMDKYAHNLSQVTVEAVNAALRKYIHPEAFVTVVAGTVKE